MRVCSYGVIFLSVQVALLIVQGFQVMPSNSVTTNKASTVRLNVFEMPPPPVDEMSKMVLQVSGQSVDSAVFRAELKKELTFFRACHGEYLIHGTDKAEIVAEGKTKQLEKFIVWVSSLTRKFEERTPTFVGPPIVIEIEDMKWEAFSGSMKGFRASEEPPDLDSGANGEEGVLEARNFMGTDEGAV